MKIDFIHEKFCASTRHMLKLLRTLQQVNDETFSTYNALIVQKGHLRSQF